MNVQQAVSSSLGLLTMHNRRKLAGVTLAQMATSFLDLLGVVLLGALGALAVSIIQGTAPPPAIQSFGTTVGLGDVSEEQLLGILAAAAAALLLGKSILSSLLMRRVFRFLARQQAEVSSNLARGLLARPLTFIQQRSSQEISYALIQGAGNATLVILGQGVVVISEASLLIVLSVLLFAVNPVLALGTMLYFALVALAVQYSLGRWAMRAGSELAESDVSSLQTVQEVVGAFRETVVSHRRNHYVEKFTAQRLQASTSASDLQFIGTFPKYVFEGALVFGGLLLAGYLFSTQDVTEAVGMFALFLAAASRILPSLLRLQGAALTLRHASGLAAATISLAKSLDQVASPKRASTPVKALIVDDRGYATFLPQVNVSAVTFAYPGSSRPVLRDVSLHAPCGSSMALVGPSGAGKSTLVDIILGILEPTEGRVEVGFVPPAEAIRRWPGQIAYVPQDVNLSNSSVRANVALGIPAVEVNDDLVWDALHRAQLDEVIRSQVDGLDTMVGERGLRLSGGQRQRLGIARALYSQPQLLVLDEATSALDAETETALTRTLRDLEGRVTTIIIAHRLSTVRHVDLVAYMEEGVIQASGDFTSVRQRVSAFDRQAGLMGLS